jgi:hypothetical protein
VGEWWLHWFPVQDLVPATLETYAQQYRRHVVPPCFGEWALSEIGARGERASAAAGGADGAGRVLHGYAVGRGVWHE